MCLAVVHGIVHSHGGALRIESEPGEGTRIELTFHHEADELGTPLPRVEQASGDDARTHH